MKKGVILVLLAMVSVFSYSQITWNVKAGMNLSNWTKGDLDSKVGFKVGGGFEYAFNDIFSIQPSLMVSTKGMKIPKNLIGELYDFDELQEIFDEQGIDFDADDLKKMKISATQIYIELPVMMAARFKIGDTSNIVISAGPYFAYGVGGKLKASLMGYTEKQDVFGDEGLDRFDVGMGAGLAFEFSKFFVGFEAQHGLTKLGDGDGAPKNKNLSLSVGYKF